MEQKEESRMSPGGRWALRQPNNGKAAAGTDALAPLGKARIQCSGLLQRIFGEGGPDSGLLAAPPPDSHPTACFLLRVGFITENGQSHHRVAGQGATIASGNVAVLVGQVLNSSCAASERTFRILCSRGSQAVVEGRTHSWNRIRYVKQLEVLWELCPCKARSWAVPETRPRAQPRRQALTSLPTALTRVKDGTGEVHPRWRSGSSAGRDPGGLPAAGAFSVVLNRAPLP
ncbi:hypothetical protein CB1_000345022 [Camelus ferus]|nr:hypothetical protein CB1_000345022 [Camelus ferus]